MIFKISDSNTSGLSNEVTILGKSLSEIKKSFVDFKKYGFSLWGKADVDIINKYNAAIKNGVSYTKAIDMAITDASGNVVKYSRATGTLLQAANGAAISQKSLAAANAQVSITSRLAGAGLKFLRIALNMIAWMAIVAAIQAVIDGISHLINAEQEAIEKADNIKNEYNSAIEEIESNASSLSELKDEFEELAKGVDDSGKNVSLSADQYARYLEIVDQVVKMNPSLIKGYNEEGQALVDRNNLITDAIDLQNQLNEAKRKEYLSKGEDIWKGANSEASVALDNMKNQVSSVIDAFNLQGTDFSETEENFRKIGIDYKSLFSGQLPEIQKIVDRQDIIIKNAREQKYLTDDQVENLKAQINLLDVQLQKLDEANQDKRDFLTYSVNDRDWYKNISSSGYLEEFNEGVSELIRNNPNESLDSMKAKVNELGESFENIKFEIPDKQISYLREELQSGEIDTETYNKSLSNHIKNIETLADQYEKTNPALSEFINAIADKFKGFFDKGEEVADPIAQAIDQLETALSSLPPILAEVEEIQSKLNDGYSFSYEEIEELKEKYPQLESAIYRTAQGWSIEKDAVDQLYTSTSNLSVEFANAQSVMTNALNSEVSKRLDQLGIELEGISSIADAYRQLGNATMEQQTDLGIPHQALTEDETKSVLGEDVYNVTIAAGRIAELQKKLKDLQSGGVSGGSPEKDQNKKQAKEQKEVNEALQEYLDLLNQRKNTGYYTGTDSDFKYLKDLEKALPLLKEFKYTDEEVKKQDTNSLNKSLYDANLAYQQQVLSVAKQRLQTDIDMQRIEENSQEHLDRLNHIYKELTAGGFELVNTEENRLALEKEILKVNQSLYKAKQNELEHAQAMEAYETTQEQHLANQKKYIEDLISLQSQYQFNQEDLRSLQEKIASEQKQYYQDVISYQQSKLDHDVAMGRVQENSIEYINRLIDITKQCHMDEETYWEYQEKIYQAQIEYERALIEARQKRYQQQQEDNDSVISAVTGVLDEEIKKLQEEKDALSDESIEGSYGAQIKAIQDRIDALQKVNEEHEKEIELEKAKAALEAAQNQKTLRVYREGEGFVYEADTDAIKEAQDNLDKLNQDKLIDDLEKEKEALEEQLKNQQDAYDKQIDALEKYKEQWSNIANVYEDQQNRILAAQKLGADWESKILSMRQDTLENFQNNYITIQERLADITAELEAFNERQTISDDYSSMYQEDIEQYEEYTQRYLDSRNQLNDITAEQQALANRKVMWVDEETSYYNHMIQITATNNALYESNMRLAESYREAANAMIDKANAEVEAKLIKKSGMKSTVQYAKGTSYVPKTDTYIVDEKGPELIVEPSVGESVTLKQGSAVIPADKTKKIIEAAANDVGISSLQEKFKDIVRKLRDGSSVSRMTLMQNLNPLNADGISNITNNTSRNIVNNNTFKFGDLMFPNINAINQVQKFLDDLKRLPLDIEQWKHGIH